MYNFCSNCQDQFGFYEVAWDSLSPEGVEIVVTSEVCLDCAQILLDSPIANGELLEPGFDYVFDNATADSFV